jgi:hypothetical protein
MVGDADQPIDVELNDPYALVGVGRTLLVKTRYGYVGIDSEVRVGGRAAIQHFGVQPGCAVEVWQEWQDSNLRPAALEFAS